MPPLSSGRSGGVKPSSVSSSVQKKREKALFDSRLPLALWASQTNHFSLRGQRAPAASSVFPLTSSSSPLLSSHHSLAISHSFLSVNLFIVLSIATNSVQRIFLPLTHPWVMKWRGGDGCLCVCLSGCQTSQNCRPISLLVFINLYLSTEQGSVTLGTWATDGTQRDSHWHADVHSPYFYTLGKVWPSHVLFKQPLAVG